MSKNESITKKTSVTKPVSDNKSTTRWLWGALGVVLALSAGGVAYVHQEVQSLQVQLADSQQKLAMTMDYVTQQQKDIPKIKVIDFSIMAEALGKLSNANAIRAMDAVIKSYNDKGYVLLRSDSVVGSIKPLLIQMPKAK